MKKTALLFAALVLTSSLSAAFGQGSFSGKVAETMNAGGYTYVLVDTGTNQIWAAANQFAVKVGDAVTVPQSEPMVDFHSKTLKRDFKTIYFTGNITVNGASAGSAKLPPGHPDIGGKDAGKLPAGHPSLGGDAGELPAGHPPVPGQPAKIDFKGIKPAKGGKTVAEICAGSAKLGGKTVTVRGKVVKYNAEIMGKNWLHIQDGTGKAGSNDILATSASTAKVGDTVLVEGKVALKKDFGSGYKYDVLIEDAKVTVE